MKEYKITFKKYNNPYKNSNWVLISSIDKETIDSFVDYLYGLERDIKIQPYIPGGYIAAMRLVPYLDKTYLVKRLIEAIQNKMDKNIMLNHFLNGGHYYPKPRINIGNKYNIHFREDLYELLEPICNDCDLVIEYYINTFKKLENLPDEIFNDLKSWYTIREELNKLKKEDLYSQMSRWVFVYMFRDEFRTFMKEKGYEVVVDGGWVLNDKKRELSLSLIDENGNYNK